MIALTIAGSDSCGGAGIQADIKTFSAFGVYGASVITALTAQNTCGVIGIVPTPPGFIAKQIDAVASDLAIGAVKTGMLATRDAVLAVSERVRHYNLHPLVVDPVMVATGGEVLLDGDAIGAVRHHLIPLADLVTPNLHEAARLLDLPVARTVDEMKAQASFLRSRFGARNVLIKGGHGEGPEAVDALLAGDEFIALALPRLDTGNTHGTGCTLSAAIAALLALAVPLPDAVERAKRYVWHGIQAGKALNVGKGAGPIDHLYSLRKHPLPE